MKMPVFFLAHGSPMNAVEDNHFVKDWQTISQNTPQPKAIVVFSAHWETAGTHITAHKLPPTIHDFGGFPPALFAQQYPAPGNPELAKQLAQHLSASGFSAEANTSWGLDHGSWVLLKRLYPNADIPVLQISLDASQQDLRHHYRIGQALQMFREQGVLFIGSGNIVHNIPKWFSARPGDSIAWAQDFDQAIAHAVDQHDIEILANYSDLPYAREAVPTVEHYLPLIYCMGLIEENEIITHSHFPFSDLSTACSRSIRFG